MPKIDYTKVENSLKDWMLKMSVKELLHMADLMSMSFGIQLEENRSKTAEALATALKNMEADLLRLRKKDAKMYETLGVDQTKLQSYFEHPETLTSQDWETIKQIREKLEAYKKEMRKRLKGKVSDTDLVESERRKQKTKRFNVRDDWIPLK